MDYFTTEDQIYIRSMGLHSLKDCEILIDWLINTLNLQSGAYFDRATRIKNIYLTMPLENSTIED